jgi:ferric-dicitrate binding protein FerR (iron transport regulator)
VATIKEVLDRVVELNGKVDGMDAKLDAYKDEQTRINNELEKRVMLLEREHAACSHDVNRKIDELRPERRRERMKEWLLFLLAIAGVVSAVIIPMSFLIQKVIQVLPGGTK